MELEVSGMDTQSQKTRTGLRCVPRRDYDDIDPALGCLLADHQLKFGKIPFMAALTTNH